MKTPAFNQGRIVDGAFRKAKNQSGLTLNPSWVSRGGEKISAIVSASSGDFPS